MLNDGLRITNGLLCKADWFLQTKDMHELTSVHILMKVLTGRKQRESNWI